MPDSTKKPTNPLLKWGPFALAILTALVTAIVYLAKLEPALQATKDEVGRLRNDIAGHRATSAHTQSAIDQAQRDVRLQAVESMPEKLETMDLRLQAIEINQDAICRSLPNCPRLRRTH